MKRKREVTPGQPTKYRDSHPVDLVEHMKRGGSFESFGAFVAEKYKDDALCVSRATLFNWADPEHGSFQQAFLDAKGRGEAFALRFWEELGITGVMGQLKRVTKETLDPETGRVVAREYAPAAFAQTAFQFMMINRFGYRNRYELVGPGDKPVSWAAICDTGGDDDDEPEPDEGKAAGTTDEIPA